jgi:general secretion pathway protein L
MTLYLKTFAAWWTSEVAAMLPRRQGWRLIVDFDGQLASFALRQGAREQRLAEFDFLIDAAPPPVDAGALRKACRGHVQNIAVRVASQHVLRRVLTMPLAAEKNLHAVLGFEMDRYTPFKSNLVYYDFIVLGRDERGVQVALSVVPRKLVDPLLEVLRRGGLEARALEAGEGTNLLPARQRSTGTPGHGLANKALAGCAALLLVVAVALPLWQKMQAIARLEGELEAARKEAQSAEQARKALEQLATEESALIQRRGERPAAIQIVQELTRLLPEDAWLNQLELAGPRVKIRGESSNASELVSLLEKSGVFKGATFDGSVTRDARSERERFVVSATAQPQAKR